MLDPVTAIGLTASVVQLLGSGSSFVSNCQKVFRARSSQENVELEFITEELERVNTRLIKSLQAATIKHATVPSRVTKQTKADDANDLALIDLAKRCQSVGSVLLNRLYALRIDSKGSGWTAFCQAVKITWKRDEIDEMAKTLSAFREQLQLSILASVRERFNIDEARRKENFKKLDDQLKQTIQLISSNQNILLRDMEEHAKSIRGVLNEHETLSASRFDEYRENYDHAELKAARRHEEARSWHQFYKDMLDERYSDVLEAISRNRSKFDSKEIEQKVLSHLRFAEMTSRKDEVSTAYHDTFEWVFDDSDADEQPWCHLITFLESGNGCYWVSGKAGSGKSTLMKYIVKHPKTLRALSRWTPTITRSSKVREDWAPNNGLIVASFFFWHAGTSMQRSQLGLIQTLLHDILYQCPALISLVLPDLYQEAGTAVSRLKMLSLGQLQEAMAKVIECSGTQFGLCLFVDGLDEYNAEHGSHTELAQFFLSLCRSNKIKAVLSSRPLPSYEHTLGRCPKLRLQDLTKGDIEFYVRDRLSTSIHINYLLGNNHKAAQNLKSEIIMKAAGVFLWVKLATNSLIEGIQSSDSISDLQARLDELPGDIEDLFLHMLKRIEPRYQKNASQILQIISTSKKDGLQNSRLTALGLSFALEPHATPQGHIEEIPELQVVERVQQIKGQVASRCCGLVEIQVKNPSLSDVLERIRTRYKRALPADVEATEYEIWHDAEVEFIHKTATDFLLQPNVQEYLLGFIGKSQFHPLRNLLQSCILDVISMPAEYVLSLPHGRMGVAMDSAFNYALKLEEQSGILSYGLLNKLSDAVASHRRKVRLWATTTKPGTKSMQPGVHAGFDRFEPFAGIALGRGLVNYFLKNLERVGLAKMEDNCRPLLFSIIWRAGKNEMEALNHLLAAGADVNAVWRGMTPWAFACICFHESLRTASSCSSRPSRSRKRYAKLLEILALAGGNVNVLFESRIGLNGYRTFSPTGAILHLSIQQLRELQGPEEDEAVRREQPYELELRDLVKRRGGRIYHKVKIGERDCTAHFDSEIGQPAGQRSRTYYVGDFLTGDIVRNSAWGAWRLVSNREFDTEPLEDCVKAVWLRPGLGQCVLAVEGRFQAFETGDAN